MDVSVIIPTYNGEKFIKSQLSALSKQKTDLDWEVIISNNGSTDKTVDVVKSVTDSFPVPIHIVDSSAQKGIAYARNIGASKAQGTVLAYCDCDDYVSDTWVQAAWNSISGGADVVGGEIRKSKYVDSAPEDHAWKMHPNSGVSRTIYGYSIIGCNFAVKADSLKSIGGFNEGLPTYGKEDAEFSLRASLANFNFIENQELMIYFRPTEKSLKLIKKVYLSGKSQSIVFKHHEHFYGKSWEFKNNIKDLFYLVRKSRNFIATEGRNRYFRMLLVQIGAVSNSAYCSVFGWPEPKYHNFM